LPDYYDRYNIGNFNQNTNFTYLDAGLPNLYGQVGAVLGANSNGFGKKTGVFSSTGNGSPNSIKGSSAAILNSDITFNAANYNPIYGKSSFVQPRSIHLNNIIKY
jgi:hypothetical protein